MENKENKIPKEVEELSNIFDGEYWDTRIIKKHIDGKYKNGEEYHEIMYGVYEVYYNSKDEVIAWTENPIKVDFQDKVEFFEILKQIVEASMRPILELFGDDNIVETDEIWTERGKHERRD